MTDNCGGAVPEQVQILGYGTGPVAEKLAASSLCSKGEDILSKQDVDNLYDILCILHKSFKSKKADAQLPGKRIRKCVDVEFLILKETRDIVVLQCRPFTKIYSTSTGDEF